MITMLTQQSTKTIDLPQRQSCIENSLPSHHNCSSFNVTENILELFNNSLILSKQNHACNGGFNIHALLFSLKDSVLFPPSVCPL